MTIHDVLRGLIRGFPNHERHVRDMLLTVDGHEKGYGSLEDYQVELDRQAAALLPPAPPDPRDEALAAAQREIAQLRAEAAQRAATYAPPAAPPEVAITGGPAAREPEVTPTAPVTTNITGGPARPL